MHGLDVESNSLLDPLSDSRPRLGPAHNTLPSRCPSSGGRLDRAATQSWRAKNRWRVPELGFLAGALHPPTTTSAKCCSKPGLSDGVQARPTRSLAISTIGSHTASQKNQHYSITSSARASIFSVISWQFQAGRAVIPVCLQVASPRSRDPDPRDRWDRSMAPASEMCR
jgi:hypothetical protein